jgi:hypothetical protein
MPNLREINAHEKLRLYTYFLPTNLSAGHGEAFSDQDNYAHSGITFLRKYLCVGNQWMYLPKTMNLKISQE